MRDLRRIDVLLNESTEEEFHNGDIVKIITSWNSHTEFIGKLVWIETSELTIDMSKEYESFTKKFKFDDIAKIEKVQ